MRNTAVSSLPSRWWLKPILGVAALAAFLYYAVVQSEDVLVAWGEARTRYLLLLSLPALGVLWAQGKIFQRSCREFDVSIGEREALSLAILNTAGNYVGALRLGVVAKAWYVKRARGVSITDTIAIAVGGAVVALVTSTFCGLLLLLYLPIGRTPAGATVAAVLGGVCVALLAVLAGPHAAIAEIVRRFAPDFARERLSRLIEAWRIVGHRRLLFALFFWQLAIHLIAAIGFYIGFALLLDRHLDFSSALAFTILTGLASIAAVTPGNLGLQELVIVAMAQSFELGEGAGVVVAASLRLVQIVVIVLLSPIAWWTLRRVLSVRSIPLSDVFPTRLA